MIYKIIIHKKAVDDIKNASDYYNSKAVNLGVKFTITIKEYINTLKANPNFKVRYKNVRVLPIKKFSYAIHFSVDNNRNLVEIHGIIHTSRDPNIWKEDTKRSD